MNEDHEFFEGDMGTKRGFGSQNHAWASQAEVHPSSNNSSTSKQSHRIPIGSTRQKNCTTTICRSCRNAHSGSVKERLVHAFDADR